MELPPLFDDDLHLHFAIAEAKETEEDDGLHLMLLGMASQPVGLGFSMTLLNGNRVYHPAVLASLGVPTEGLLEVLRARWSIPARAKHAQPGQQVPCFATTESREAPTPAKGLRFTLKDLRWESGTFTLRCSAKKVLMNTTLVLNRDARRVHLQVPKDSRTPFVRFLSGELKAER